MIETDKSLQIPVNQQIMSEGEWDDYAGPIRYIASQIREKYGKAPNDYIYTRPGGKAGPLDYVREEFFTEILNEHFPDWSFLITDIGHMGQLIYVAGRLILNFKGVRRVFDDTGEDKAQAQEDGTMVPGAVKSATTDCFKRCCHRALGAAQNVYNLKDIERKKNISRIKNAIEYIEEVLGEPEPAISSDNYSKLQQAHKYFLNLELPTTDEGWDILNNTLKRFQILKEAVDAERRRS